MPSSLPTNLHRLFLLLGLAAATPLASAQQLVPPFPLPHVVELPDAAPDTPVLHVLYDVDEDRIRSVRSVAPGELALGNPPCFDNSDFDPSGQGFALYVVANPGEELVDWGRKRCRASSLVRRVTIGYASSALPVGAGGPGGTLNVALYHGTEGFGVLGTELFRRTLSGLPVSPSAPGSSGVILLTIDFGIHPLLVPDGRLGWGFLQLDGMTGPFLVRAPRADVATHDALDLYAPGEAPRADYQGTFNYGGCSAPWYQACASMWMQIDDIPVSEVAHSVVRNGSGVNPLLLIETQPARLGGLWAASLVSLTPSGLRKPTLLFTSLALLGPVPSPFGEQLIDPDRLIGPPQSGFGGHIALVPPEPSLAGLKLYVQGAILEGRRATLSNALEVTVGY